MHKDMDIKAPPISPGRIAIICMIGLGLLILVSLISILIGTVHVTFHDLVQIFQQTESSRRIPSIVILKIRLPRIILAAMVGFSLSMGGVVFQAVLRNPLADPFILGVSSGSAMGAVLGIMFGLSLSIGIPVMAFGGALISIILIIGLGSQRIGMESHTLLLVGVIINAFFTALVMFFISIVTDDRLHGILFWLYGDLSQSEYSHFGIMAGVVLISYLIIYGYSKHLNLITAGEEMASHLGINIQFTKKVVLLTTSICVGVMVSFSGLIGFVGLIVPHMARILFGSDHRLLLPVSAIGGAIFLICADTLARTIISPTELPVGVVTAFLGAPFFLYLLLRKGASWSQS